MRGIRVRRGLAALAAIVSLAGTTGLATARPRRSAATAVDRGGSNYLSYRVDADCTREPYGVVDSYDKDPATIARQLAEMFTAGQRRLRIPVLHHHGPDTGTVMDSTGGGLSPENLRNLRELLEAVRLAGFEAIEVALFPMDANDPRGWRAFDQSLYEENRAVVRQVREVATRSRLPYTLDLLNEGAPGDGEDVLLRYTRTLWGHYRAEFGTGDTVGFSMRVWIAGKVPHLPGLYGDHPPPVLEIHLYGQPGNGDEFRQFMDADAALDRIGYRQPLILGEVYYNDREAAAGIRRATARGDRPVRHLTQWPYPRRARCPEADVAPPAAYGAYSAAGF